MAKPTEIPTWATDAGATNDPGASRKATGFLIGKKAPAKWFNWLHNRTGQWCQYLSALHNEPEFLNKNYSWTGIHKLAQGYIANNWGVSGEVVYANPGTGTPEARARTVKIPPSAFVPGYDDSNNRASWRFYHLDDGTQIFWHMASQNKALIALMSLPHHSVITSVRAGVAANGALGIGGTMEMTVGLFADLEGFEGSEHESAFYWGVPETVKDHTGIMTAYPPSNQITGATHTLAVRFVGLDGGQCRVFWAKVAFDDPGPRNF